MLSTKGADVYTDFNGLAKLKNEARKESPEALKETAKQFESIFLNNVLKSMRAAKLADGALDNEQSKFYNDMYDQQLAVHLSGSPGVGLADLIVKQLSHDKPKPNNNKQGVEDYLNKPVGMTPSSSGRSYHGNPSVRAKVQPTNPPDKIAPLAFNTENRLATKRRWPTETTRSLKLEQRQPITSAEEFIRRLHPHAEKAARELGVEPKVLLAQAALESGWGRSLIKKGNGESSFNLFNIKADKSWRGEQARLATLEFDQGVAKKVNSGFRSYGSFEESFKDYVDFIKSNPRYGDALKKVGNAERYMHELQRAGYATDPKYAAKVMSIYQGDTMARFEPGVTVAMN
ncbi:MAG: flagellar assembly peptidoglycan hydrolase FlgJ [Methylobacter sp.]|nr:flagellar assembly peptidoglycan hydrolase FlgJ [Methylobacter sp.]MDP2097086.1 flagellar assembly peptidoglycan hydrolase FlgJ [Methylobacter sp.]MDP2428024.1 flagellar assembly peptidoglycan hydrolase FlgJ [Methylobacter sp.]MDP3055920.1 flagellar assembly peptidoglycan hydrolase FlgJ [Methylobacter sp.]MDP3363078.1 flagellar assembly peptidoglycan hydrolase FlgJ [Methylobacter sp.]